MVTGASTAIAVHAVRRYPSRHTRRQASASGRPQGATTISDPAIINAVIGHIPISTEDRRPRTTAVAVIPTGSHNSEAAMKIWHERAVEIRSDMASPA